MDTPRTQEERTALAFIAQEEDAEARGTASIAHAVGGEVDKTLGLLRKLQAEKLVACEVDVAVGEEVWVTTAAAGPIIDSP